jgi:hypothetical protein
MLHYSTVCSQTTGRFPSPLWWCTTDVLWCTTPPLLPVHPLQLGLGTLALIPVLACPMSTEHIIDALWYVSVDVNLDTLWIATRAGSTRWRSCSGSLVRINLACCYKHVPLTKISMALPLEAHVPHSTKICSFARPNIITFFPWQ